MSEPTTAPATAPPTLRATHVYALAAVCLVVGLGLGYLLRDARMPAAPRQAAASPYIHGDLRNGHMPSPEELRQIAAKQAAPLLEKLKTDPKNVALLVQVGGIYHGTRQYPQAESYYSEALQLDPTNIAIRTKLATSLFRDSDPDAAIAQLRQVLAQSPNDANALFDLGVIRLEGKGDRKGAVAAWAQLLKTNPQLSPERKASVTHLMNTVQSSQGDSTRNRGSAQQ